VHALPFGIRMPQDMMQISDKNEGIKSNNSSKNWGDNYF